MDSKEILGKPGEGGEAPADGWSRRLRLGATGSFNHSDKVIGTVDGTTIQLGAIVDGALRYVEGARDWQTTLAVKQTQTRTPQLSAFIKSADDLTLASTVLHRFPARRWLGLYGRARLTTALFHGFEVRPEPTAIVRSFSDPSRAPVRKVVPAQTRIALTRPFDPTLVREGLGGVALLGDDERTRLETRLGGALQHVLTRGGFAVTDDPGTAEREYRQIHGATQAGAELDLSARRQLGANILLTAEASFFYPLYSSRDLGEASFGDRLNSELGAKLSVQAASWLSIDYVFAAKHIPLITEDWQVQHGVIATAGGDLL